MTEQDVVIPVYGRLSCADTTRSIALLDALGVPYELHKTDEDPEVAAEAERISGSTHVPVVVLPDGTTFVEPTDDELALALQHADLVPEAS